jgi:predicted protein tyrosine phosphatase
MENPMVKTMQARYKVRKEKIACLDIPNRYTQGEQELRAILEPKILEILLK